MVNISIGSGISAGSSNPSGVRGRNSIYTSAVTVINYLYQKLNSILQLAPIRASDYRTFVLNKIRALINKKIRCLTLAIIIIPQLYIQPISS